MGSGEITRVVFRTCLRKPTLGLPEELLNPVAIDELFETMDEDSGGCVHDAPTLARGQIAAHSPAYRSLVSASGRLHALHHPAGSSAPRFTSLTSLTLGAALVSQLY